MIKFFQEAEKLRVSQSWNSVLSAHFVSSEGFQVFVLPLQLEKAEARDDTAAWSLFCNLRSALYQLLFKDWLKEFVYGETTMVGKICSPFKEMVPSPIDLDYFNISV